MEEGRRHLHNRRNAKPQERLKMIFATTLSLVIGTSGLDTPITFEAPGERLDVIVERLAEMTGSDLTIGAEEHGHYLTISVTDMPLEELLDGIARVTVMSWMPDRGGLRLVPDNARRSEIAEEIAAEKAERFKDSYQEWLRVQKQALAEMGEYNPLTGGEAAGMYQRHYMELYVPIFESLFPYIDAERVGQLRPGERIVFATDPTRMQVPLRGVPPRVLADLTETIRAYHSNARVSQRPPTAQDLYRLQPNSQSVVDKVSIGIKPDSLNSSVVSVYDLWITLYETREGRNYQVQYAVESLNPGAQSWDTDRVATLESLGLEPIENVQYGDLVTASLESVENSTMQRRFQDHSPAFQEIALDLVEGDPQMQIIAPFFIQLGERNDVQVIANVSDRSAFHLLVRASRTGPFTPFEFLAPVHDIEMRDKTLLVRPLDVADSAADRVDRRYVSEYISRFRNHRLIPFESQLEFVKSSAGRVNNTSSLITRVALGSTASNENYFALRLLREASNAEVDWILSDVEIPYQQLSAPLRQAIHEMIFNHELGVSLDERGPEEDFDDYVMTSSRIQDPAAYEVTEVFPMGIPGDTVLRVRAGETWMFANAPHKSQHMMNVSVVQDVFDYARNKVMMDNAPPSVASNFARIDEYYVEKAVYYGFRLQFNPHFRSSFHAIDLEIGPDAELYHFTQFPPEIANLVNSATERMRSDPRFNWVFDQNIFGGRRPPP